MTLDEWWALQDLKTVRKKDMAPLFPDHSFNAAKQKEVRRRIKDLISRQPDIKPKELSHRLGISMAKVYHHYQAIYNYAPKHQVIFEKLKNRIRQLEEEAKVSYCKQCSLEILGVDTGDFLRGLDPTRDCDLVEEFMETCAGCGDTWVDESGTCVYPGCKKGHR